MTVTSTPSPTETPIPTPTFHPQFISLQESIAAASGGRFTLQADGTIQDGIETIPGLTVAPDGTMTLTVGGETVTLDPAYVNFDDENGISIDGYDWDEEAGGWVEVVTFEPMTLETDPSKMGVCTYEDITSGRLDWNIDQAIKNGDIVFPEDAHNGGLENRRGESNSAPIFLSEDSKNAMQLVNLCEINNEFLGFPKSTSYVASVAVLNADRSVGTLNIYLSEKSLLDWFLKSDLQYIGITKSMNSDQAKKFWDDQRYGPLVRLYPTQGEKEIMRMLNELQNTGVVGDELSKTLIAPSRK